MLCMYNLFLAVGLTCELKLQSLFMTFVTKVFPNVISSCFKVTDIAIQGETVEKENIGSKLVPYWPLSARVADLDSVYV